MPGLMGLDEMVGAFNGEVTMEGEKIQVRNGAAMYKGLPMFFSADGKMVLNRERKPVAQVQGGNVVPLKPKPK
jgi:hypothetical protein